MAVVLFLYAYKIVLFISLLSSLSTNVTSSTSDYTAAASQRFQVNVSDADKWITPNTPSWPICSALFRTAYIVTWIRPSFGAPFRPQRTFSSSCVIVSWLLLLAGDIEVNPGPTGEGIIIGSLNTRSAIKHAADVSDLIISHSLDVAALCETRTQLGAHDAVNMDFVPDGYNIINQPRSDGRCGGGLAIVYKRHLNVAMIENNVQRTTFDLLI